MAARKGDKAAESYRHNEEALLRPDVGTQAQFKKKKPPKTYRYDSSLSPALDWDGQNPARELGEWLIAQIDEASRLDAPHIFPEPRRFGNVEVAGLADAVERLKALSQPFLDWSGKAERLSFDVPTLPLFVHERLSTKAILQTLAGHERDRQMELQLFADPQLPLHEQLDAYVHKDKWVNRMILGDSLVVMNSLLEYEGLGGQVQMIYIDPPYGVKFGSNFQPFVRKRDVKNNEDADMTREPEMVKAYRDTWELGLHSYLTYLRDRLLVARDLLTPSGSVFVQIGDENVHLVRSALDDVFGHECHVTTILVKKKGGQRSGFVDPVNDYLVWYSKRSRSSDERASIKFRAIFEKRELDAETLDEFTRVEYEDGGQSSLGAVPGPDGVNIDYRLRPTQLFKDHPGAKLFRVYPLTGGGEYRTQLPAYTHDGHTFGPGKGQSWKHSSITDDGSPSGMDRLAAAGRLVAGDSTWGF